MSRENKAVIIDELAQKFTVCDIGILTDYRGLTNMEMTSLRRRLRESGIEYRVVKNTLARFAAVKADIEELVASLTGPIAVAFGYGDITAPAKVLVGYIKSAKTGLGIKGGFLSQRVLTAEEVVTLATLPSREVLLAKVVGGMQAPIVLLVNQLAAPLRGLVCVLQAKIQQVEEK